MAQPFELKFLVDLSSAISDIKRFADGWAQALASTSEVAEVLKAVATGVNESSAATERGTESLTAMATASQGVTASAQEESAELARLTELLGSEELARASLNSQIIDGNAEVVRSETEVAASLARREQLMAEATAKQAERQAQQASAAEAAAIAAVPASVPAEVPQVVLSDATKAALATTEAAEAARALKVAIDDLAQAQRNLAKAQRDEPGNLALIARAEQEVAVEAQRVAQAEDLASVAKARAAEASQRLRAEDERAAVAAKALAESTRAGSFTAKTQELGTLVGVLGIVNPQFFGVAYGLQMLGQAAETFGPKIAAAGGGVSGFLSVLGPIIGIGAGVVATLGAMAAGAAFVGESFKAAVPEQESETSFAILLGNVALAKARLEELDQTALKFRLDPTALREASEQLTRFSQGVLGSGESLNTVIEISARSGKSLGEVGGIVGRFYEVIQSGQPIGRMGRQLMNMNALSADALVHLTNLQKEGAKGPQLWKAVQEEMAKSAGAAQAQANTFEGAARGIKGAWEEILEAFGRPIVDSLTPVLRKLADLLPALLPLAGSVGRALSTNIAAPLGVVAGVSMTLVLPALTAVRGVLTFFGSSLVTAGGAVGVFRTALFGLGTVFSVVGAAVAGFSLGTFLSELEVGGMKVKEWGVLVVAGVVLTFNQVKNWVLGIGAEISSGLAGLLNGALATMGEFAKNAADLINKVLPEGAQIGTGWAVKLIDNSAGTQGEIDAALAGRKAQLKAATKKAVDDFNTDVDDATKDSIQRREQEANAKTGAPNEDTQFSPTKPGAHEDPYKKPARDGRAKSTDEATEAEKRYKAALLDVKGEIGAGEVSQEQATAQQVQATQQYIASLTAMQSHLDPASDKFHLLQARIEEARASLLKLKEGQDQYDRALALTNAQLEAGDITQAQANQRNAQAATAYIGRLTATRAALNPASAAFADLTTKIEKTKAALAQTSVFGNIRLQLTQLANGWSNLAKQAGDAARQIATSITNGIGNAITGLIEGTTTWQQAFQEAGKAVIATIVQMVVQYTVGRALIAVINAVAGNSETSAADSQASAAAVAWSPAATSASIASYGVAAGVGLAAYVAALATGAAAAAGASAFLVGGHTGYGQDSDIAGIVHKNEYVIPASATRFWGLETLQAISQMRVPVANPRSLGGASVTAAASTGGYSVTGRASGPRGGRNGSKSQAHHTYVFFDEDAMARHMAGTKGTKTILNAVTGHAVDLGIRTA